MLQHMAAMIRPQPQVVQPQPQPVAYVDPEAESAASLKRNKRGKLRKSVFALKMKNARQLNSKTCSRLKKKNFAKERVYKVQLELLLTLCYRATAAKGNDIYAAKRHA